MPVLSKNPGNIHPSYKEAVVDSLLNGLYARVSGSGEFYNLVYGAKPSVTLMSGFIVPMPDEERLGDEEADPIRISAHGLDFQICAEAAASKLTASVMGSVYVRILPAEEDIKPGGRLEPTFPLTPATRAELRVEIKNALARLSETLPNGKANREWPDKSLSARKAVYAAKGLAFSNTMDRTPSPDGPEEPAPESEATEATEDGESRAPVEVTPGLHTPDHLAQEIPPPPKWLRLDLTLPSFTFSPETAAVDADAATAALNASVAKQIADWAASLDPNNGGQMWGYRRAHVKPSHARNWNTYLESIRKSKLAVITPTFDLRWIVQSSPDPLDPTRMTLHVALENWSPQLTKTTFKEVEHAFFQVSVSLTLPSGDHRFLQLDRVKPSYRYNRYLKYPALGFNGGVTARDAGDVRTLTTTWSPRYVLPRIIPAERTIERSIQRLAQPDGLQGLRPLVIEYRDWLGATAAHPVDQGLDGPNAAEQREAERVKLAQDLEAWRQELKAIEVGIRILEKSRLHWKGPGPQKDPLGIPFEAWISMNAAMAKVAAAKGYDKWRLFQIAFILASIPAFATRIPAFHDFYDPDVAKQSDEVTLLYFSTGGGKSEAFLGLLAFVVFLDRLRGKHLGVSALMRYPLRLLTLQQARRTFAVLGAAEQIRYERSHPGEPFSLGFWVGGTNTPNWHTDDGYDDVPKDTDTPILDEPAQSEKQPYKGARERWMKLTSCPFCLGKGPHALALRRHTGIGGNTLGHFCTAPKEKCPWNSRFAEPRPLPFYVVDEDIYDLAPTVLLGTVDKLSALGQSQGTIRKFFGMFGFAPLVEATTERLYVPMKPKDWEGHPGSKSRPVFPAFATGEKRFFDPFPALLIQDEAHLLDESLGTFSGLFESALEAAFDELAPLIKGHVCCEPNSNVRRRIKVIAASATVNEPKRQMRNLYQRDGTMQFPHPGPTLYDSFYAMPAAPDDAPEDVERAAVPADDVELRSHWARVYVSLLTNGHRHTVAMAAVLAHYHLMVTGLYDRLRNGVPQQQQEARDELLRWVSPGPLQAQYVRLLQQIDPETLLTLVDLHRIALTYVTNKKGGDQVIDTEKVQFEKLHRGAGNSSAELSSELISGAVSAAEIQDIVRRAETRVRPGEEFPELNETLRSVIATSAISHGVDVEEFNAMFFAGIPSDIAEYIQASSRVGRTHVGFSLLVPVPQRYRDRFVLEIHDIFHRFLERMILPAAVDRWAEKALVRVMPSFFQEYVCGIHAIQALAGADDEKKRFCETYAMAHSVRAYMSDPNSFKAAEAFMERALGLNHPPSPEGRNYYRALLRDQLGRYKEHLGIDRLVTGTLLVKFFAQRDSLLRPMTSLRDVDQPGIIRESRDDAFFRKAPQGATARAMTFIRRGSGADIDSTDAETEAREPGR